MTNTEREQFEALRRQNEYLKGNNEHVQRLLSDKEGSIRALKNELSIKEAMLMEKGRADRLLDEKATLMDIISGLINPEVLKDKKFCPYCNHSFNN